MNNEKINGNFVLINKIWILILIGIWIFSMGVAYAVVKTQVDTNTTSIQINAELIEVNKKKINTTSANIKENNYNIKSICKALNIDFIK